MILFVIIISSSFFVPQSNKNLQAINKDLIDRFQSPTLSDPDSVAFEGSEVPLNITDYGNLYVDSQDVSLDNQAELNLNYYLDDVHDWKVSKISTQINNIQDTREWVRNRDFSELDVYRVYVTLSNIPDTSPPRHNYTADLNHDPSNPSNIHSEIIQNNASLIRVHFSRFEIETDWDIVCFYDESNVLQYTDTGNKPAFFSPWIKTNHLKITMDSDGSIQWWGYDIDYYEYTHDGSEYYDSYDLWGNNSATGVDNYGSNSIDNETAMYVSLVGEPYRTGTGYFGSTYYENDFSEIYQNITIPRGQVIDGYISFDYYAESAMSTNENFMYCAINDQIIYSKGIRDIVVYGGRRTWLSTGSINLDLWLNTSNIFEDIKNDQEFRISLGIMSGASISYSGFDELHQQIFWFDNLSLELTTLANSSQSDINLTIDGYSLNQGNEWGSSDLNLTGTWTVNPVILTVNTSSPSLSFELDTYLYGYHEAYSRIGQTLLEGTSYEILENGTVYWYFTHNFFMPSQYSDFEFIISKPSNWQILYALDPTLLSRPFENGNIGESFLKINKTNALYSGWWSFKATSPNFIQEENVKISRNGQWGVSEFQTGDIAQIKTQINKTNEIPPGLEQTIANLTIYSPEGDLWFEDSAIPMTNGTVVFSNFNIAAQNSTGGIYNFKIFWGNGTSVGGIDSNFVIRHDSYIKLLRPDDAKSDNRTGGVVGDILPLRIYLRDTENNESISNAILSFNWTSGTRYLVEVGLGIYDAILDTSDLGSLGLYTIIISSYKIGFENSTLILEINLGEDTVLQRLGSDSSIIINQNSTITFFYYSKISEEGITDATVAVNISNPMYYSVTETTPGTYSILINTVFLDSTGTYQLFFEFSAPGYEPQSHIYQFNIVNPPPPSEANPFLLILITIISISVIAILGALSIRSYVILPRRRRREADLLSRTQRFKDIENIQAIVAIHKDSGIPLYTKSYSILEKQKKEIFAGFIQAIITVGEEMVGKRGESGDLVNIDEEDGTRTILELDFKYFYCLICDRQELRIIFILTERASDRLKSLISDLSLGAMLELSEQIGNWDGAIHEFEDLFPPVINNYIELYLKEPFVINSADYIAKVRKEGELNSMETRILNVIYSIAKSKKEFNLETIFELIHEKNKDIVIEGIESLIKKKVIVPSTK
ncbi:MAG: hypothetical protein EAX91_04200 [Candidatus Lokiarchaeota archaeon]|nr:hypothetical protein [Candidatus Lokiarchaeota archaeon]